MLSTQRGPFLLLLFVLAAVFPASRPAPASVPQARRLQQPTQTATPPLTVRITSLGGGEALQGVVSVAGTSDVPGFRSAEVSFAYQNNPTGTWFLIQQNSAPVKDGALASWDTTGIADGIYRLRLQVFLADGRSLESEVTGLRIRNYSPVETSTPGPKPGATAESAGQAAQAAAPAPTITPTFPDFQPAAQGVTPVPTNPVQVDRADLQSSALRGVAAVAGVLLVLGAYLGMRALGRR